MATSEIPAKKEGVVYNTRRDRHHYRNEYFDKYSSLGNAGMFNAIYNKDYREFGNSYNYDSEFTDPSRSLKMQLKDNEYIDVKTTMQNLGIVDAKFTLLEYVASMLEKIETNYNPDDASQKEDIKTLWKILTSILNQVEYNRVTKNITKTDYFQKFLRNAENFKSFDEETKAEAREKKI
jgi:hypothetical protein